jgi:hypothetical protein
MAKTYQLIVAGFIGFLTLTSIQTQAALTPNADGDFVASADKAPFVSSSTPKLCAAIRGNGGHLMAHFGGLAQITESFGLVDGISGGSSAAVSVFFYESMVANPVLWNCGDHRCTEEEVRPRLTLMLKSIMGGVAATIDMGGGKALTDKFKKSGAPDGEMGEMMNFLKDGFQNPGGGPLRRRIIQRIADRMMSGKLADFEETPLGRLINDNHRASLRNFGLHMPPHRRWEILLAAQGLDFNTEDVSLFFREGVLDYDHLVNIMGRVGDFYSNRGPINPKMWSTLFSKNCVEASKNITWEEMVKSPVGASCARVFDQSYKNYMRNTQGGYQPTRLNEPVGYYLNTLVSDSVILGEGVKKYNRAYQQYRQLVEQGPCCSNYRTGYPKFRSAMAQIPFQLNFMEEVRFGYWGRNSALRELEKGTSSRKDDMKSSLFMNLGTQSWKYILRRSPAEPGLSKLVPMGKDMYSSGGWSDLHPIPVLKDIGCEKVVYISRTNTVDSEYGQGIVHLFNIPADVNDKLYNINNPDSSSSKALKAADAVLCSNWNAYTAVDFTNHFRSSYTSPVATQDPEFQGKARRLLNEPLPGCVAP